MSVLTAFQTPVVAMPPFAVRKFSVDEYHQMIAAGVFDEDEAIELLEGWITPKMARNPPHEATIHHVPEVLRPLLPPAYGTRIQSAITTSDSEPEPDVAVVVGPAMRYVKHHPGPADITLLIEVADSSLSHDRQEK